MTESIEIRRGIDDVWTFVSDLRNDVAWCPKVKAVDRTDPSGWRVTHKPVPLRPAAVLLVRELAADPPHGLKLHEEDAASVFEVEYQLQQTPQGTRLTQISVFSWKKLPSCLHAIAYGVTRDVRRQLRELKRILETEPA